jgi:hypothetical protein
VSLRSVAQALDIEPAELMAPLVVALEA